jgi:FKBP-type peptidyl-prolyl cis-trans isomerase 2
MAMDRANTVREGAIVTLAYTLHLRDGAPAELPGGPSPLTFVVGDGSIPKGLEEALLGLAEGGERHLTLKPGEAFGPVRPDRVVKLERSRYPANRQFQLGQRLKLRHKDGRVRQGIVFSMTNEVISIDLNHPLAGKSLGFDVQVLKIDAVEASPAERSVS